MRFFPDLPTAGSSCFKPELKRALPVKPLPDHSEQRSPTSWLRHLPTSQAPESPLVPPERERPKESSAHAFLRLFPAPVLRGLGPGPAQARHGAMRFAPNPRPLARFPKAHTFFQRLQACPIADQVLVAVTTQSRHAAPFRAPPPRYGGPGRPNALRSLGSSNPSLAPGDPRPAVPELVCGRQTRQALSPRR